MKITKFVNCCFLVEMPDPVNRTLLFDPGRLSEESLNVDILEYLDDIVITHEHGDHYSPDLLKKLVQKFPDVRVLSPSVMQDKLQGDGVKNVVTSLDGVELFDAPHAKVEPLFPEVDNIGVHYLNKITHPGDSFNINETKPILALPIGAPWGDSITAVNLAIRLKPQHILPMHDFHWGDGARNSMYDLLEDTFKKQGIIFHKLKDGEPVVINV